MVSHDFKRDFYYELEKTLMKAKVTFLFGPLGCGKTVALKQLKDSLDHAVYIDFRQLSEGESRDIFHEIEEAIAKDKRIIYLLDEITYAPCPEKEIYHISTLHSTYLCKNTKIVFSGGDSIALDIWSGLGFCGCCGTVHADFIDYNEWLRYKGIEYSSEDSYRQFLNEVNGFHGISSMKEYIEECYQEAIIANSKAFHSQIFLGDRMNLVDTELLLYVCHAALNQTVDSLAENYSNLQKKDAETLKQVLAFLHKNGIISITDIADDYKNASDYHAGLHSMNSRLDYKKDMFKGYEFHFNHPMLYMAVLNDVLDKKRPEQLPQALLEGIVECHIRRLLAKKIGYKFRDKEGNNVDFVDHIHGVAVKVSVSNEYNGCFAYLPFKCREILLSKDKESVTDERIIVPYHKFIEFFSEKKMMNDRLADIFSEM